MSGKPLFVPRPPFRYEKFIRCQYAIVYISQIDVQYRNSEYIYIYINVFREFLHFTFLTRSPICVMIKTYLYTPRVRSIDKRQESNKVLLWSIWSTRRREYLQRQSPRLSTLRGNLAYNSSQLRQQLLIVTRVWNFNAKTFERAIRTEADPYSDHSKKKKVASI